MKDKISKPDKMDEALDSLDQYINNLIKKHDQEMQRVVEEKEKEICDYKYWRKTAVDYADKLEDKVKQLEQQLKESREVSVEDIERIIYVELESQCGLDEWDMPDTKKISTAIFNLINGDKQ